MPPTGSPLNRGPMPYGITGILVNPALCMFVHELTVAFYYFSHKLQSTYSHSNLAQVCRILLSYRK